MMKSETGPVIVFFYRGWRSCLDVAIEQAHVSNPSVPIYVLTDNPERVPVTAIAVPFARYYSRANEFARQYVHMSSNPHDFELACLQRWFVIHEWMVENSISSIIHLDGDVLLWCDVTELAAKIAPAQMTITGAWSPHGTYVMSPGILQELCDFIVMHYVDPSRLDSMKERYQREHVATGTLGGIHDMLFFLWFAQANPTRVRDLGLPTNGFAFDMNMEVSEGYKMFFGMKHICWKDGLPHALPVDGSSPVRLGILHFCGVNKAYMGVFDGRPLVSLRYAILRSIRKTGRYVRTNAQRMKEWRLTSQRLYRGA